MIVGLTGGIGSGKSEVSRRFQQLGIVVVDADIVARQVVEPGKPALEAIRNHFGDLILDRNTLNRTALRHIIFSNPDEKIWLENLLHPVIRSEIIRQLNQATSLYKILVSPLLLETTQHELVDRIVVVDADEKLQIARASQRDNASATQIDEIMKTQMSRQERNQKADDIIYNHGNITELDKQVNELHHYYLKLSH